MEISELLDRWEVEYKKGLAKPLILLMLTRQPNYAYALTKDISAATGGRIVIQPSNMYPLLKSLKDDMLVSEDNTLNPEHTMYKITEKGYQLLTQFSQQIQDFYHGMNQVFRDQLIKNPILGEKKQ